MVVELVVAVLDDATSAALVAASAAAVVGVVVADLERRAINDAKRCAPERRRGEAIIVQTILFVERRKSTNWMRQQRRMQ